jgi:hypothetical protein
LILDDDIISIGTDSLGVIAVLLLAFLDLWDQILGFIVWIPTDPEVIWFFWTGPIVNL